jgi:hypothetical protein
MNLIKFSLITVLFSVIYFSVQAQNVKPKFKKFQFIVYNPDKATSNKSLWITDLQEVNQRGEVYHLSNFYLDNFMADTIYNAPDSLILKLNDLLTEGKRLESHRTLNKMPRKFSGPLIFINYTTENNKTDNIIFVDGYVDKELEKLVINLRHKPLPKTKQMGKVYRNKPLESLIFKYHLACKYIPKSNEEPPAVKELIKN